MRKKNIYLFAFILILFFGCYNTGPSGVRIENGIGTYLFSGVMSSYDFAKVLEYFSSHRVKKVIIEIHSPGGSLFEVWRIVSLMEEYENKIEYETRVNGIAGSGGFLVFLMGNKRLTSKHATFMWHNKKSPVISNEANKFFDDATNKFVASRTGMTLEEVQEKIQNGNKEWYFGAKEAISLGVATGYIN